VGFGLLSSRWAFSAGRFYRVLLPAARLTPNLEESLRTTPPIYHWRSPNVRCQLKFNMRAIHRSWQMPADLLNILKWSATVWSNIHLVCNVQLFLKWQWIKVYASFWCSHPNHVFSHYHITGWKLHMYTVWCECKMDAEYRGAGKSLARPGR
jgi:hypothetical protein